MSQLLATGPVDEANDDDSQQVATIGGIEEENVVDVPASSTIVEGNALEGSTVTINNAPVTNIINNFQQVRNNPVAEQPQDHHCNEVGISAEGLDIQCRWFTLKLHVVPATVLASGTVCGVFGLGLYGISAITQIVEVVAPLATQVILKVISGSLFIHVLTQDNKSKQVLLDDLASNRLLKVIQDIAEESDLKVEGISLVEVAAVVITQQEYKKLKKSSKNKLKKLRACNADSLQEKQSVIIHLPSIFQNKARVLSVKICPEDEQDYIVCLKRDEEFSSIRIPSSSKPEILVTEKFLKQKISADLNEGILLKQGFFRSHSKFSEFIEAAKLHPGLLESLVNRLHSIKKVLAETKDWNDESLMNEVDHLTNIPIRYFTGHWESVLRNVLKINRGLIFCKLNYDIHFKLYDWVLGFIENFSESFSKGRFLKAIFISIETLLLNTYERPVIAQKGWQKWKGLLQKLHTLLFECKQVCPPRLRLDIYFKSCDALLWDLHEGLISSQSLVQRTLDLVLELFFVEDLTSSTLYKCRKLVSMPTAKLTEDCALKAFIISQILRSKSKFYLSLLMLQWCIRMFQNPDFWFPHQRELAIYALDAIDGIVKFRPKPVLVSKKFEQLGWKSNNSNLQKFQDLNDLVYDTVKEWLEREETGSLQKVLKTLVIPMLQSLNKTIEQFESFMVSSAEQINNTEQVRFSVLINLVEFMFNTKQIHSNVKGLDSFVSSDEEFFFSDADALKLNNRLCDVTQSDMSAEEKYEDYES